MGARGKQTRFEAHSEDIVLSLFAKLRRIDRKGTQIWEEMIDHDLERLFAKWEIYEFTVNGDAYTGIVLECRSRKYGDVVIKIYPPFLRKRYIKESFILTSIKGYPQARLLDLDDDSNAMLLERVIPGDYISYAHDRKMIANMFINMQDNKLPISAVEYIPSDIQGIIEQTKQEYEKAIDFDFYPSIVKHLLDTAECVYDSFFAKEEKYLLHGDAYFKNALVASDGIKVIDPVGYKDAFIFEYMPFLTYELALHTRPDAYLDAYHELVGFFSGFAEVNKISAATFVFLVKQLVPSIYEANDDYKRAKKYMQLIEVLFSDGNNEIALNRYGA